MAEYIDRVPFAGLIEHLDKKEPCKNCYHRAACDAWVRNATTLYDDYIYSVENCPYYTPTTDVVEVVRCKDCIHAIELDKHCDINRAAYKHCTLLRGDETKYVWHKYKKYYKDYSIVEPNDFCSYGIKRGDTND